MKQPETIQQICLASTKSAKSPVSPKSTPSEIQRQQFEKFNSHFAAISQGAKKYPNGFHRVPPYPLLVSQSLVERMKRLHEALSIALTDVVERWWTDEKAAFPSRMPVEGEEEEILRWVHAQSEKGNIRPFRECQGHWRADFLLESTTDNADAEFENIRICEINSRFSVNTQMIVAYGYAACTEMATEAGCLSTTSTMEEMINSQIGLFDLNLPIHFVADDYQCDFLDLLLAYFERQGGIQPRVIKSSDLYLIPDIDSPTGFALYSKSDRNNHAEPIHQVGMLLFQHELRSLPRGILRHLALCCVSDIRSVFLVDDKRMLGIVLEELDSLLDRGVLDKAQAEILRQGIVPTVIPGSLGLNNLIRKSQESDTVKNKHIIKPFREGRGEGILFGEDLSDEQWRILLTELNAYIIQPVIRQPRFEVMDGNAQLSKKHIVGSYHLTDGNATGLGIWRAGRRRISELAQGESWMVSMAGKNELKSII
ncbi:hypothetical protein ASPWEDRAFT_121712 [Aspergillus wentii DTO 134E9]|uniref:Glutathionylspermidine synthase pre-ATP-grasp-like domain-containing protein n=1 Tax=Aspergillus wentii DTO 134E9 TaxID=1073089 RepID=A0A1L9R4D5_ASPWE|nr:uncharacterized protein ASPWEDRAFT_121712 [Aspergillus wentii DTO 134E9]OJJ29768.1 hypothetical protein ASPWEDRAFT_121712 [Aspergillus wentii DTO 134E9]